MAPRLTIDHPGVLAILKGLKREWRIKLFFSAGVTLTGVVIISLFFLEQAALMVLGALLALGGFLLVLHVISKGKKQQYRLLELLMERPGRIVWVYTLQTQRMPYGFHINRHGLMYFKLIDGNEITVELPAKDLEWVSRSLNEFLPHATFGYSHDKQQWYLASPELLLKDTAGEEEGI